MYTIRIILLIIGLYIGYEFSLQFSNKIDIILIGLGVGLLIWVIVIFLERGLRKISLKVIISGSIGLFLGLIFANLLTYPLISIPLKPPTINPLINIFINIIFGYIGMILGVKKSEELELPEFRRFFKNESKSNIKILDTSVIIDGRIADICETGFLEGELVIPQFILKELQQIADSSDSLKRNRGRRGLDILQKMQKNVDLNINIVNDDFPKIKEVDTKLIALSQKIGGVVVTNDFNLNKIAELQGVSVLNINQLANAVKPVVLPGEEMNVFILKEGKEYGQGIAYLDDGTMVVVDNARKSIGKNVDVSVTSVLQTTAGRMIFTKLKEEAVSE
ncbi:MAG: TRAM domain-containing protein [Nitrospinae bacterium]|nr:TRAM domain-containing protein [Nitrospinota bacterium]